MPNISNVVWAFRLRCYLSRSYEKHPLLLLEPLVSGPSPPERVQWYLYDEKGACRAVELRKLQPLCLSQDKERQLLQELRGLKQADGLGRLSDLWLASIKGIALRSLACGQLLAPEGVWVVRERSFYALLPKKAATKVQEASEQAVKFGIQNTNGTLTILESFPLPDIPANADSNLPEELLLCRLRLENAQLLCMEAPHHISSLRVLPEAIKNRETLTELFLFAPTRIVDHYSALSRFLHERLRSFPSFWAQAAQSGDSTVLSAFLQQLALDYKGWGPYSGPAKGDGPKANEQRKAGWKRLGGWQLREEVWHKAARHAYQRACQFGGYPKLETELANYFASVPSALIQSLLAYLYGKGSAPPEEGKTNFWASCVKVDGYTLAAETLHPKARETDSKATNSAEEWGFPERISPQGRRFLQSLYDAGRRGLSFAALRHEEPVLALIRSGWAVLAGQNCYARSCAPPENKISDDSANLEYSKAPVGDLGETLLYYKKKNQQHFRKNNDSFTQRNGQKKSSSKFVKGSFGKTFPKTSDKSKYHKPEDGQGRSKHSGPHKPGRRYQENRDKPNFHGGAKGRRKPSQ